MSEHTHQSGGDTVGRAATKLMIRRCAGCDKLFAPLTTACSSCGSLNLESVPSSGLGSIVAWRLVHRCVGGPHTAVVPLTIAIVELDDGPWVYTTIEGDIPPFSDPPIRVRFEPHPRVDRFPVFAVCPATPATDGGVPPTAHRGSTFEKVRSTHRPDSDSKHRYDTSWVRAALHECDFLESAKSMDAAAKALIGFAIRWAPFGGAAASELLVTFGVTRRRFLHLVEEALHPRRTDSVKMRVLKRDLKDSLAQAWRMNPAALSADGA
ncbi:hypothetical protein [Nocardia sp. NPDC050793]|uniref:Zn-ribbon domain-containing OB-fold protein n=1 Tax=Nocardia sp. NPDC050793 TaxID=3155159 RepID=UPI0033FAFF6E